MNIINFVIPSTNACQFLINDDFKINTFRATNYYSYHFIAKSHGNQTFILETDSCQSEFIFISAIGQAVKENVICIKESSIEPRVKPHKS